MDFGKLLYNDYISVAENRLHIFKSVQQLMRRFVEHHGAAFVKQLVQMLHAGGSLYAEEALEGEAGHRKPGHRQCGNHGRGSRHGFYGNFRRNAHFDQSFAGVAYAGHTRVGDYGAAFPRSKAAYYDFTLFPLVELLVNHHGLFDSEMVQQLCRDAGILRGDKVHLFKGFHGAGRKIAEVAYGRSYNIKLSHLSIFRSEYNLF